MTIHQPISITIDLKNKMFNLFFSIIPEIVTSINGDSTIKKYFDNFFKFFTPNYVTNNFCVINDNEKRNQYIKNYQNVENSHQMKVYFESIPGLYSKLALWAMDNSYQGNNPSEHHLILRSLRLPFDFNQRQISISYNLVQVHWLVHYLFHYIRLIEYGQIQDEKALYGLLQKKQTIKPSSSIMLSEKQRNSIIENQNDFLTNLRKDYVQFEQERAQRYKNAGELVGSQRMNPYAREILTVDSLWQHIDDYKKPEKEVFKAIHRAQPLDRCSLQRFAEFLIQAEIDRNTSLNINTIELNKEKIQDVENVAKQVGAYFGGRNKRASIYGFYLVDPPPKPPIRPVAFLGTEAFIKKQQSRLRNQEELTILKDLSQFTLANEKLKTGNILKNQQFNVFSDIAQLCIEIEKKFEHPTKPLGKIFSTSSEKPYKGKLTDYIKNKMLILSGIKKSEIISARGLQGWKVEKNADAFF